MYMTYKIYFSSEKRKQSEWVGYYFQLDPDAQSEETNFLLIQAWLSFRGMGYTVTTGIYWRDSL